MLPSELIKRIGEKDMRALARCISIVENETHGAAEILQGLEISNDVPVVGVTGPPGAGKSTLLNAVVTEMLLQDPALRIAILAVDPTSPFTHGSLLGDRLRMSSHFNAPNVFIRSLATRGSLGGLSAKTIEVTDVLKSSGFDYIFIETVGVGQSEVEIAGLADVTIVVFVPESGDEIQTLKSGIMEIADIFVVNKADRDGSDKMKITLQSTLHERQSQIPVFKTTASSHQGIGELVQGIKKMGKKRKTVNSELLYQRGRKIAESYLFSKNNAEVFRSRLLEAAKSPGFNVYRFIADYYR